MEASTTATAALAETKTEQRQKHRELGFQYGFRLLHEFRELKYLSIFFVMLFFFLGVVITVSGFSAIFVVAFSDSADPKVWQIAAKILLGGLFLSAVYYVALQKVAVFLGQRLLGPASRDQYANLWQLVKAHPVMVTTVYEDLYEIDQMRLIDYADLLAKIEKTKHEKIQKIRRNVVQDKRVAEVSISFVGNGKDCLTTLLDGCRQLRGITRQDDIKWPVRRARTVEPPTQEQP